MLFSAAQGLAQASVQFPDLGKAQAAVGRVFDIIDRPPAINSSKVCMRGRWGGGG